MLFQPRYVCTKVSEVPFGQLIECWQTVFDLGFNYPPGSAAIARALLEARVFLFFRDHVAFIVVYVPANHGSSLT
jgi:hypothetical protein